MVAAGLAYTKSGQTVAPKVQDDLYDVKGLAPLFQVADELDLGRGDQVEVIGEPRHLHLHVGAKLSRKMVSSIVNGYFHF